MLDASDHPTIFALRELVHLARRQTKPVLVWVGAGASSWAGYPRWADLAEIIHRDFARLEARYDSHRGNELLATSSYPELFQLCRDANDQRYHSLLAQSFSSRPASPVYSRFINALAKLPHRFIVTTNIDQLLDKSLPDTTVVIRPNLQHALTLQQANHSFVYKLHGSVGDIGSIVFTRADYDALMHDANSIALLARLLGMSSVLFIGYSLQDEYVLNVLSRNADINALFGDGPHFAVLTDQSRVLPRTVRMVRYIPRPHKDHRTAISVLEEMGATPSGMTQKAGGDGETSTPATLESAHLLFEVYPPGTWTTSQTLGLSSGQQLIIGSGFTNDELPDTASRAMHDLLVGMLAFDCVYVPVHAIGRVHDMTDSGRFWRLVESGAVRFVHWTRREGVLYSNPDAIAGGQLGTYGFGNPDGSKVTAAHIIREQLKARPGFEKEVERRFGELEAQVVEIGEAEEEAIADVARGLLLRPSVRRLIAVSEGTPVESWPRWAMFPVLRLAQVVRIGTTCRVLRACSARLDFGRAEIGGPAFAAAMGVEWVDPAAGYVLAGSFAADLGAVALEDSGVMDAIMTFRELPEGKELRLEIFGRLQASEGAEVSVAINGGLRETVPSASLQRARDRFIRLFAPSRLSGILPPAIWNDRRYAEDALSRWRRRSKVVLDEVVRNQGLGQYSVCPCGSGEKLRFCCWEALAGGP